MCVAKWEKMCLKKPNVIARGDKKGLFKEKGFKCQGRICNSLYLKKIQSIGHWKSLHLKVNQGGARGARTSFFQLN